MLVSDMVSEAWMLAPSAADSQCISKTMDQSVAARDANVASSSLAHCALMPAPHNHFSKIFMGTGFRFSWINN